MVRHRVHWMGAAVVAAGLAAGVAVADEKSGSGRLAELKTIFIEASSARDPAPGAPANLYPSAARRAGVEGQAMLRCTVAPEDRFTDCEVIAEGPAGQGFGANALIASKFVRQAIPGVRKGERVVALLPFSYTLEERRQGLIADNQLDWEQRPTAQDLSRAYPQRAQMNERDGWAIIGCHVTAEGRLADCRAYDEWPHDYCFTEAALSLSGKFKLRSKSGAPLPEGGLVRIPVFFRLK